MNLTVFWPISKRCDLREQCRCLKRVCGVHTVSKMHVRGEQAVLGARDEPDVPCVQEDFNEAVNASPG